METAKRMIEAGVTRIGTSSAKNWPTDKAHRPHIKPTRAMDRDERILLDMVNVAVKAGGAILEVKNKARYSVKEKADNSPVTDADYAAQDTINSFLGQTGIPVISEEGAEEDYSVRKLGRSIYRGPAGRHQRVYKRLSAIRSQHSPLQERFACFRRHIPAGRQSALFRHGQNTGSESIGTTRGGVFFRSGRNTCVTASCSPARATTYALQASRHAPKRRKIITKR